MKILQITTLLCIALSVGFRCSYAQESVPSDTAIISPDGAHSFKIKYYDRSYHFFLEDLGTKKVSSFEFEQGPVLAAKWALDSKSLFIAAHYARGKLLDVIREEGDNWKLSEITPPENNMDEYEVLDWKFQKAYVSLFFKFILLDEGGHPTDAYKCSLDYNPSTGAVSNYKKEKISFDAYGKTKSELHKPTIAPEVPEKDKR